MKKSAAGIMLFLLVTAYPLWNTYQRIGEVWSDDPYIDELFWIPVSNIAFDNLFLARDFRQDTWNKYYYTWGSFNPAVGKLLMGAALYLGGAGAWRSFPVVAGTYEYNPRGALPDSDTFYFSRLPGLLTALMSYVLLYVLLSRSLGRSHAVVALILVCWNPIFRFVSGLAVTDFYALGFGLLATLLFTQLLRRMHSPVRGCALAAAAGLAAGLCAGCKLSGFLYLISMLLFLAGRLVWRAAKPPLMTLAAGLIICVLAIGVFIGSNPFLYKNTLANLRHMYGHKQFVTELKAEENLAPHEKVTVAMGDKLLGEYNTLQIAGHRGTTVLWNALLLLTGLVMMVRMVRSAFRSGAADDGAVKLFLLCWCALFIGGTLLWSPKPWYRFLMPAIIPIAVLQAAGLVEVVHLGITRLRRLLPKKGLHAEA